MKTKLFCVYIRTGNYKFANSNLFGNKIFNGERSIEDALEKQAKMKKLLLSLKKYDPSNEYKKKERGFKKCRRSA